MIQMLNTFRNLSFTNRYIINMAYMVITCIISKHTTEYLHIPFSMLFFIVNYGCYHTELYLSLILLNITVILLFDKSNIRTYSLMALNLFTFGIVKQFSDLIDLDVKNKNNISIQFMLLVPKMYYTSKELIDVRYLFYLPGILAGPIIPLFDFINRKESFFHLEKLIYTTIFGVILMLRSYFPYEMLVSKENQGIRSFVLLFVYGFLFRSQFYFAWSFSSFCYALCGLKVDNLDPIKFESAENVQEVMRRWNVYVSIWLKQSVFLPSKKYGNTLAALLSCIVSSMWHGFYISYFMMFLSFPFCVTPLKNLTRIYQTFIPVKILKFLNIFITSLLVSFFSVPFYFLSVTKTIEVWRQVYYYGLVYVLIGYLSMGFTFIFNKKEKKE